jgi:hypothetical protein
MYLTYHNMRRRKWTEHRDFPTQAVKWWQENKSYQRSPLLVYQISEDRTQISLVAQWNAE